MTKKNLAALVLAVPTLVVAQPPVALAVALVTAVVVGRIVLANIMANALRSHPDQAKVARLTGETRSPLAALATASLMAASVAAMVVAASGFYNVGGLALLFGPALLIAATAVRNTQRTPKIPYAASPHPAKDPVFWLVRSAAVGAVAVVGGVFIPWVAYKAYVTIMQLLMVTYAKTKNVEEADVRSHQMTF